ncbi:MAG: hypothetical protein ACLUTO_05835 [Anaerostipes sp.]
MYFDNFSFFSTMYGGLTSILLTLFWLYFCMMMLFIGAEINHYFISQSAKNKKDSYSNKKNLIFPMNSNKNPGCRYQAASRILCI